MANEGMLRSWKEISRYLGCDRKTCARWEAECGLPVRRIDTESSRSRVFAFQSELDQWLADKRISSTPKREARGLRGFVLPAAAGGLVLVAAFILKATGIVSLTPRTPVLAIQSTVPPGSSDQDHFLAEGFRREIQRKLSALGRIQFTRLPSPAFLKTLSAAALDALARPDFVLEGSLQKPPGRSKFSVCLRKRRNDKVVWSGSYENPADHFNTCLNDVCNHVFRELKIKVQKREDEAAGLAEFDSYEPYLSGQVLLSRITGEAEDPTALSIQAKYLSLLDDEEANQTAFKLFNQVLETNPRFAPALVGLAQCYVNNVNLGEDTDLRWLDMAEDKIRQAEAIEPNLADYPRLRIHILLLRDVLQGKDSSETYFALAQKGLTAHPHDAGLNSIVGYGWFLEFGRDGHEDDFEKALQFKKRAFWGAPCSMANYVYAELLMLKGDFEEALKICSLIQPGPNTYPVDNRRAEIYFYMGELEKSEAILRAHTDPRADLTARYIRGMIAARRKDIPAARGILGEIERLHPPKGSPFVDSLWYASILAGIGETAAAEEAVRSFFSDKKAQETRFISQRYIEINPNFHSIKSNMIVAQKGRNGNG